MYLNAASKIIFFHVPKNAGTTVQSLFVKKYGKGETLTRAIDVSHMTPKHVKLLYDLNLSIFSLYMISRNPYDSEISYYLYMIKNKSHRYNQVIARLSFDEYLEWRVINPGVSQIDYYFEGMVVFQFERMDLLYKHFSFDKAVVKNTSGSRKRKFYTKASADIVYNLRKADFRQFKYSKDSWSRY